MLEETIINGIEVNSRTIVKIAGHGMCCPGVPEIFFGYDGYALIMDKPDGKSFSHYKPRLRMRIPIISDPRVWYDDPAYEKSRNWS